MKHIKMNITPENVLDETLLQAKVVHAQLLIKTNTLNIAHQVFHIHKIRLEVRTIQSGEFKLLIQLDLEDVFTGQSLATFRPLQPTGNIITKLKQQIDTDIDTIYQIIEEHPGLNCTVFRTLSGV